MTIPILPAIPPIALATHAGIPGPRDPETGPPSKLSSSPSRRLDLSAARAHDAALAILGAYKLTGNFPINLEIVLKHLGALDMVTPEIEAGGPSPFHSDCRHVVFRPAAGVPMDRFTAITRSITDRIGFDATLPWWGRLFH
jgi:hypothetical protein